MEPFGEGNPEPVFMMRGAKMSDVRTLGKSGATEKERKHVSFMLSDGTGSMRGVWWYHGEEADSIREKASAPVDVLFCVSISDYCGEHVELRIVDMRPSEA
jgi:single-stranded DNA-specific DHH superfamily exonuclease